MACRRWLCPSPPILHNSIEGGSTITPLSAAVQSGSIEIVRMLVVAGADVNDAWM